MDSQLSLASIFDPELESHYIMNSNESLKITDIFFSYNETGTYFLNPMKLIKQYKKSL